MVDTRERRLYLVTANGQAIRYGIGVGRDGFRWGGVHRVTAKKEWPSWTPPSQMLRRRPDLPRHMEGGPDNPLGARAMYLGSTLYRIHGSNEPETIGQAVSSGCFRMVNDDVIDLYDRVRVGRDGHRQELIHRLRRCRTSRCDTDHRSIQGRPVRGRPSHLLWCGSRFPCMWAPPPLTLGCNESLSHNGTADAGHRGFGGLRRAAAARVR